MKKRFISVISILLLAALFVQGCGILSLPVYTPPVLPALPELEEPPPLQVEQPPAIAVEARRHFTLRYEPDATINPILAQNRDNILLTSLVYESLFVLDEYLLAVPYLVSEWYSEDNMTFTFHILPDILMHDGDFLTARDVAYSINQAMQRGRHVNKLRSITNVQTDGELTVIITISAPNARFVRLLDIPIIRSGTRDMRIPPGSGPFIFDLPEEIPPEPEDILPEPENDFPPPDGFIPQPDDVFPLPEDYFPQPEERRMIRFPQHRYYAHMPLSTIYLRSSSDGEVTTLFDEGFLHLLWDDPTGAFDIRLNRMHEPRFFHTTSLQFLGFNANTTVLRNPDVRRAISSSIDRQYIVENIMNIPRPGQTVASPLAISPMFDMYDPDWEPRQNPLFEMGALLDLAGLIDYNHDGLLEMPDGFGGFRAFTLDFIVNIENLHKVAAAEKIAADLRLFGIDVNVRTLPWNEFLEALNEGRFDIYYGEVQLGADFDLSPLLLPGENNLNFGNTANAAFSILIAEFLAAGTQEEMSVAGGFLVDEIRFQAPFAPILYKRHAIYSPTGLVSEASPSQSGVFHNFQDWTIDSLLLLTD